MDRMQYGFYFDQNRCTGCFTCVVACRDWNDVQAGPASWIRLKTIEKGNYPDLFTAFLPMTCYHCAKPACISVCPNNAIAKRQDNGIVEADREQCIGCGLCVEACPYSALQLGTEENAKIQKCNLCVDRLSEGKKPICVDGCPMRALDAGPITDLRSKYCNSKEAEGFEYSEEVNPSIIFKPKTDTRNLTAKRIIVIPSLL